MFLSMFFLGLAAGLLSYVVIRVTYELWKIGAPTQIPVM
jgi:hypothetical protein